MAVIDLENTLDKTDDGGVVKNNDIQQITILDPLRSDLSNEYSQKSFNDLKSQFSKKLKELSETRIEDLTEFIFQHNVYLYCKLIVALLYSEFNSNKSHDMLLARFCVNLFGRCPEASKIFVRLLSTQIKKALAMSDYQQCYDVGFIVNLMVRANLFDVGVSLQLCSVLLKKSTDESIELSAVLLREINTFAKICQSTAYSKLLSFLKKAHTAKEANINTRRAIRTLLECNSKQRYYTQQDYLSDESHLLQPILFNFNNEEPLELNECLQFTQLPASELERLTQQYKELTEVLYETESEVELADNSESSDHFEDNAESSLDISDLRKNVYLVQKSSTTVDMAVHKIMSLDLKSDEAIKNVADVILDCCARERTFEKTYSLQVIRLIKLMPQFKEHFCDLFKHVLSIVHSYDRGRLRNIAEFFAYLFATDSLPWTLWESIRLTEDDTSTSERIFIKFVLQCVFEIIGSNKLAAILNRYSDSISKSLIITEDDDARNFSIEFFKVIGLEKTIEKLDFL